MGHLLALGPLSATIAANSVFGVAALAVRVPRLTASDSHHLDSDKRCSRALDRSNERLTWKNKKELRRKRGPKEDPNDVTTLRLVRVNGFSNM